MSKKLIIDLDGTVLNGALPINDSMKFFSQLESREIEYLIMTNSVKSPMQIKKRLAATGLEIPLLSILNPIIAINSFLKRNYIESAYIVGSEDEILQVHANQEKVSPEIILLLDFEKENYNYSDLQQLFLLMQKDVPVISASGSPFYLSGGKRVLDTGAFVNLFQSAMEKEIDIYGKPSRHYFNEALNILESDPSNTLVIGDDWSTDGKGALEASCSFKLVKTGKYKVGDENKIAGLETIDSLLDVLT